MVQNKTISVELVYIEPTKQNIIKLQLPASCDINQAIQSSGLLERYPEIDLTVNKIGVFSKIKELDTVLMSGDRIEIYRPLQADPKDARRRRAKKENE